MSLCDFSFRRTDSRVRFLAKLHVQTQTFFGLTRNLSALKPSNGL